MSKRERGCRQILEENNVREKKKINRKGESWNYKQNQKAQEDVSKWTGDITRARL